MAVAYPDEHQHDFRTLRDGGPPACRCGAWLRIKHEVVTDEPRPSRLSRS